MFRMISALEEAGHETVLYLYDRYSGDMGRHEQVIRQGWPEVRATVKDASLGFGGLDACVATGWQSAHVMAKRARDPMRRLYFVQDYEPYFYPRGSEYALAEDSYKFGFRCIALGPMVSDALARESGICSDEVPFGCDTTTYRLENRGDRSGIVFFSRPDTARRGYLMGRLALEIFHARHPQHEIHIFGTDGTDWPVPIVRHGRLTPTQLNVLYNSTIAGLALSFTNITLVAAEMLASGAVPIVNEMPYAANNLPNPYVSWCSATPDAIANALGEAVTRPSVSGRAVLAASAANGTSWDRTQAEVVRIIEDESYEPMA